MTTKTTAIGIKTATGVKAGGWGNHNQSGMAVRSKVTAGALSGNHNQSAAASR
jgi:hypothetical protein